MHAQFAVDEKQTGTMFAMQFNQSTKLVQTEPKYAAEVTGHTSNANFIHRPSTEFYCFLLHNTKISSNTQFLFLFEGFRSEILHT